MTIRTLDVRAETWPLRTSFRIARGAKTEARVVVATIATPDATGRGECVPYARYGETVEGVIRMIEAQRSVVEKGLTRAALQGLLPPGAARNALDCALIDWEAKRSGKRAHALLDLPEPQRLATAFTLSLDTPDAMAEAARFAAEAGYHLLKLKVVGDDDLQRVAAVRQAVPEARLIVDANEGWSIERLAAFAPRLALLGVALIEQPLPAAEDSVLAEFTSAVPLCADESCHTRADLGRVVGPYSHINIKLDKAGGLTEAIALAREARARGLGIMVGCMVSTSLAMAPAVLLGAFADIVDLDGPLLLARDREPGLRYEGDRLYPPGPDVWG